MAADSGASFSFLVLRRLSILLSTIGDTTDQIPAETVSAEALVAKASSLRAVTHLEESAYPVSSSQGLASYSFTTTYPLLDFTEAGDLVRWLLENGTGSKVMDSCDDHDNT
jgi:hypothetical protein